MSISPSRTPLSSSTPALQQLQDWLEQRRASGGPTGDLEAFEEHLHTLVMAVERDVIAEELARYDLDTPEITIDGVRHRRVLRCADVYQTAAGEVRVERSLYRTNAKERAQCPLELQAGLIGGRWTPRAARQTLLAVAHLTPREVHRLFDTIGNMAPSKASIDRVAKHLSAQWETERETYEITLRSQEQVPEDAVTVSVSLDGVRLPMRDGQRRAVRAATRAAGRRLSGPAGYRDVGCGTTSFYDVEGKRLLTRRYARMPETCKVTLKAHLAAELKAVLEARPELTVVTVADAAPDNWRFFERIAPDAEPVLDFFHAVEHLKHALIAAYGETHPMYIKQFIRLRRLLRDEDNGVHRVIRSLYYLKRKHPRRKVIGREFRFFRRHRKRMTFAALQARDLPIGSGVVEASCKTLVTERMKRSGMRWRIAGGQAILTFRALEQSGRFDRAWTLLKQRYCFPVSPTLRATPAAQAA